MARHRSSAVPLAWLYAALIVYASLYPFSGWRWPPVPPFAFLLLPWPRYWTSFDLIANLLGYLPLGFLLFTAQVRAGASRRAALVAAVLLAAGLSLALEVTQNGLPSRVPANVDWALNSVGAGCGALAALAADATGWLNRWQRLRDRWFVPRSAGALALLSVWPLGLLFPLPVAFGVGQLFPRLQEWARAGLGGTPLESTFQALLTIQDSTGGLSSASEMGATVLGLMAPCLLGFSICRPGWRRPGLVLAVATTGLLATTLSTALNFGPEHATAWFSPMASAGIAVGLMASLVLAWVPSRAAVALCLMALTGLVFLVAQAPQDSYFAQSLQAWEQGRFIRFHGAAQWIGWLWPYAAMVYLLARVADRDAA